MSALVVVSSRKSFPPLLRMPESASGNEATGKIGGVRGLY
jgi:hypothetical protein